ncbi:MAG: FAD-dependent oxidoreductase [Candidatus Hodgkinia cicadicola]|nr:MAG: FAD-dependent oxidoreductase [Candidatus Hodgkinia cicadicola]
MCSKTAEVAKRNSPSVCATCDGFFYKDKTVAVIGSGNTTVTGARYLSKVAKRVCANCKHEKLSCEEVLAERLAQNGNVKIMFGSKVTKYVTNSPTEAHIHGIQTSPPGGETSTKQTERLHWNSRLLALSKRLGKTSKQGCTVTEANATKTSASAVFAAGDVNSSCRKQVTVAAGLGCFTASEAEQLLCT